MSVAYQSRGARVSGRGRVAACWLAAAAAFFSASAAGEQLGRLFSTPAQRADLDEVRSLHEYGKPPQKKPEAPAVQEITVNGLVVRSSGNNASWINGAGILGSDATREGIRVESTGEAGGTVRIVLPDDLAPVQAKPGQKLDVVRGGVLDAYQQGGAANPAFLFEPPESSASPVGGP